MLTPAQLRPAAFSGFVPRLPLRAAETGPLKTGIARFLGQAGVCERIALDRADADFLRFYNGDVDLFLRIEGEAVAAHLQETEGVARWLKAQGAPVNAALPEYPKDFEGRRLFAYPFLHARYLRPDTGDMQRLGEALRVLHDTLAAHPNAAAWRTRTQDWLTELSDMRAQLASGAFKAGPYPDALAAMAADTTLDFIMADLPARPCHGDINAGNVMAVIENHAVVFLDFEDVVHSVLPPAFELMRVIERQLLVHEMPQENQLALGQCFLRAYGAGALPDLQRVYRSHILRTCCILAVMEQKGIAVHPEEWQKFFTLWELAARSGDVLAAMARGA